MNRLSETFTVSEFRKRSAGRSETQLRDAVDNPAAVKYRRTTMQKPFFLAFCIVGSCFLAVAAPRPSAESGETYQLSTHILDVNRGAPASGVPIILFRQGADESSWVRIAEGVTDRNGRIGNFLPSGHSNDGIYKLKFETGNYFREQKLDSIYPFVEVVFEIKDDGHYHIPITISANGYATYRGN